MSDLKTNVNNNSDSDENFQDALSNVPVESRDAEVVEEIVPCAASNDEDCTGQASGEEDEAASASVAGLVENEINEDELRENEKKLTEVELWERKEQAEKLKLQGNECFKNDEAERSCDIYTRALKLCPTTHTRNRAILYGNRAAAKIKLDLRKSAIDDCCKAIDLFPEYERVLLRRAKLYEHEDKLDEALEDYKRVNNLNAGQREALEALVRLPPQINERNERMKEEMVSKLKDLGNMILKPFGLSTSNFQMQQDPNTGSYSINFQQNSS